MAGMLLPPTARKPMKVVRPVSPPCLRNVHSECEEPDDWHQSLASLPRAQHQSSSRYRCASCPPLKKVETLVTVSTCPHML